MKIKNKRLAQAVFAHFCAAHRLPNHKGRCSRLHGHNYEVRCGVWVPPTPPGKQGFEIDFSDLKLMLNELVDDWDHSVLLYTGAKDRNRFSETPEDKVIFLPFIPTAENMAMYLAEKMLECLLKAKYKVYSCQLLVQETPGNVAIAEVEVE